MTRLNNRIRKTNMKTLNPIQLNNWEIKKFLNAILAVQLAVWGTIGLDIMSLQIPILRQLIGFIYLTLVPGILILRILKIHKLGNVETFLYTIGLSAATVMFIGLIMNIIYPFLGISRPISLVPLVATMSVVVFILCVLAYIRDKDFSNPNFIKVEMILSPPALFLYLIPFFAIFGTYIVNFYQNNIIQIFLIVIISVVVILIIFDKFVPKYSYPLAIFVISLSLLYHDNLISSYLTGFDVHPQYYFAKIVEQSSYWNLSLYSNVNAMVSVTLLPVIYSKILSLDITWVFKIIYPIFFALIPVALYQLYKKYTSKKISFLACFFFISFPVFWTLRSMTQYLGEFFFALLLLLNFRSNLEKNKKIFLSLIFISSLIVSHYGTTYLVFFFYFILTILIYQLLKVWPFTRNNTESSPNFKLNVFINPMIVLSSLVLIIIWYTSVGGGSSFRTIIYIKNIILNGLSNFSLPFSQSASLQTATGNFVVASIWRHINWFVMVVSVAMIALGFIRVIFKPKEGNYQFRNDFLAMLCSSTLLIGSTVVLPNFANFYNVTRLYHLSLFFLALLMIIGVIQLSNLYFCVIKKKGKKYFSSKSAKYKKNTTFSIAILCILLPYFLFNTGLIYEITDDAPIPSGISLSFERIKNSDNTNVFFIYYYYNWSNDDIAGAKWLSINKDDDYVYADYVSGPHVLNSYGLIPSYNIKLLNNNTITKNGYFYLFELNLERGVIPIPDPKVHNKKIFLALANFEEDFDKKGCVYSNGGVTILKS